MEPTYVGLWLDQKKAIMTFYNGDKHETVLLESNIDRRSKATGGSRGALPYTYNGGGVPDKQGRKRDHELHSFYQEIFEAIKAANQIYLMGPGLAKNELKKYLEEKHVGQKIAGVKDLDQLTDNQLAAETRHFFKLS